MQENYLNEIAEDKIDLNKLLDKLKDGLLEQDTDRKYELFVVALISLNKISKEEFNKLIEDNKLDLKVRYAAFFALCTIYRRNKEYTLYGDLIKEHSTIFQNFKSFPHLKAMHLVEIAEKENEEVMRKAIKLCKEAKTNAANNAGFLHNFAITVVKAFEEEFLNKDNANDKQLLEEALEAINDAIELESEYAKFHSTKGRLKCLLGDYPNAKKELKKAIDLEDSSTEGYSLKIGDYQQYLLNITYKESIDKIKAEFGNYQDKIIGLEGKLKHAFDELENAKTKNLELLGFFTALLSFTIGSIQILNNQKFVDAIRLILVLCGSLLLVLGGFGITLNGKKNISRNIIVWLLGILIIFMALFSIHKLVL